MNVPSLQIVAFEVVILDHIVNVHKDGNLMVKDCIAQDVEYFFV